MLCQRCKKNVATVFIDAVINDKSLKAALCAECATGQVKLDLDKGIDIEAENFIHSSSTICKKCNTTLSKIISTQRFGCANCYEVFGDYLLKNKTSVTHSLKKEKKSQKSKAEILKELEQKLAKCIEKEKYEEAAILRDEIKKIKES